MAAERTSQVDAVRSAPRGEPDPVPSGPGSASIARDTLYNLIGYAAPLLVALFAVPALIGGLGTDGFGMLAIAWMFLGYFSLFDLGLSRALTQLLSDRLGREAYDEVPGLVWTTITSSLAVGVITAGIVYAAAPLIANRLLNMPEALRADSLTSFRAVAFAVPFIITTANMRGVLEAIQRFDLVNFMRVPLGIATFGVPLLVFWFGGGLAEMVIGLVAARIIGWIVYSLLVLRTVPSLRSGVRFDRGILGMLFRFGGWMTVSNVISPLMVYMDRFLIGALVTASAVAFYATPWEVVTKFLLIPTALSAVLFPSFSFLQRKNADHAASIFRSGVKAVFVVLFPIVLLAVAFARPALAFWVDPAFAESSYRPMQILAIGVLFNGTAAIPFALIQGLGKPDLTARIHLIELPLYLGLLWVLLDQFGIVGAAVAWSVRVTADFVLLYGASIQTLGLSIAREWRTVLALAAATTFAILVMVPSSWAVQAAATAVILPVFGFVAWSHLLGVDEKQFLTRNLDRCLRWI